MWAGAVLEAEAPGLHVLSPAQTGTTCLLYSISCQLAQVRHQLSLVRWGSGLKRLMATAQDALCFL
jgi:hypothetical protein